MASERPDHTLSTTALVHEAWLRLAGGGEQAWAGRSHFYFAAARAMRRILIDHARKKGAAKRGGGLRGLPLDAIRLATREDPSEFLSLHEALLRLEDRDERAARVVNLRFFAGLSERETAETMGLDPRTVRREWRFARAWLERELARE
jgi:RNA polymerase sigma factor (TIGR02999 family)